MYTARENFEICLITRAASRRQLLSVGLALPEFRKFVDELHHRGRAWHRGVHCQRPPVPHPLVHHLLLHAIGDKELDDISSPGWPIAHASMYGVCPVSTTAISVLHFRSRSSSATA